MEKNLMINRTNLSWLVLLLAMAMSFASCHKNETDFNGENSGNESDNPSVPIVPDDPEGTVTINLNNGVDGNWYNIGIGTIHIDNANNFEGMDFVCLGEVEGLGYVTTIPTEGWSNTVAVVPGQGYVAHYRNQYARLYVVDYYISTGGGIMGATIKYQSPFQVPISFETSSLSFDNESGIQNLRLLSPTSVLIDEKPEWCTVSVDFNTIMVSVTENNSIYQRVGDIILKNEMNSVVLSVSQQGYGFEGGSGTEQDPFQIKTAQQLAMVSIALDAHYKMIADIDLTSYLNSNENGWEPIGKDMNSCFSGTFDGDGHTIRELWVDGSTHDIAGLFGMLQNATIRGVNVIIGGIAINGKQYVGGIAAIGYGDNSISECSVSGSIRILGTGGAGGICGGFSNGNNTIKDCFTEGTIYSIINNTAFCSGIVVTGSIIENCYSKCTLEGKYCVGIGVSINGGVSNCYFAGRAYGDSFSCDGVSTYFDSDIIGSGVAENLSMEHGRTTAQMRQQSTYEGWDFVNTWRIDEGRDYPKLRCFD